MKLSYKTLKVGTKVIHKTFRHWGVGEVAEVRSEKDFTGHPRKSRIVVQFSRRELPAHCCLSDLRKATGEETEADFRSGDKKPSPRPPTGMIFPVDDKGRKLNVWSLIRE